MIGSVSPAMHKYIWKPAVWVLKHKLHLGNKKYNMHELQIVRDYEKGKVTKEQLDKLSTCDVNAVVNNGLPAISEINAHVFETNEVVQRMEKPVRKGKEGWVNNKGDDAKPEKEAKQR